jgi:3-oxoacyl-[acyl-carrier-protein] synthase-3
MTRYAHITGWGMAVPEGILTNDELAQMVDTSDEWIRAHSGIRERRIAGPEQTSASLAVEAAQKALEVANIEPTDLDLIIVASASPEHIFPATACLVQDRIGAAKAGAFDLSAACTGFIFALNVATQAIRSESAQNILVVGTETLSRFVNWRDRNTCILFADGAGAFILQGSEQPGGVLSGIMHSDGSGSDLLSLPAGGSRLPASLETVNRGDHYIHMNGREVFRFASRAMAQVTREALAAAHLKLEDIHLVVPHQANIRIIENATRDLGIPLERCVINLESYGNTSTASIPIAVCEAIQQDRLHSGDRIVLVGFGGGLTWGANVIQWSGPFPARRKVNPLRYRLLARLRSLLLRLARRIEAIIWERTHPEV